MTHDDRNVFCGRIAVEQQGECAMGKVYLKALHKVQATTNDNLPETVNVTKVGGIKISDRTQSLFIVAVFPAVFWVGLIALVANLLEHGLSKMATVGIALAIAVFLGLVFGAVSSRRE